jgi:hypothetical protein
MGKTAASLLALGIISSHRISIVHHCTGIVAVLKTGASTEIHGYRELVSALDKKLQTNPAAVFDHAKAGHCVYRARAKASATVPSRLRRAPK